MLIVVMAILAIMAFLGVMWGKEYSKRVDAEATLDTYRTMHENAVNKIEEMSRRATQQNIDRFVAGDPPTEAVDDTPKSKTITKSEED